MGLRGSPTKLLGTLFGIVSRMLAFILESLSSMDHFLYFVVKWEQKLGENKNIKETFESKISKIGNNVNNLSRIEKSKK